MKIGELANKTGCSIQSIRFYERNGLLKQAERTQSNYRQYDKDASKQLTFIKQCRSLDMSISEIKELVANKQNPNNSCANVNAMIEAHLEDVSKRIDELVSLKSTLTAMSNACTNSRKIKNCGVLQKLDS